ncbi:MAG: Crp/Fnr family transcriptional regulator [Steroidobacteraceae bacterium]|jgi:CRP-like cAMP-binding protein
MSALAFCAAATPQNMLLAALTAVEWDHVRRTLRPIFMPLGGVLYEPGMNINQIYFPMTSVICISRMMNDGSADAVTLIGREGFAGIEAFLGSDSAPCRAVVLSAGWGYRVERECLSQECHRDGSLRSVLLRYIQSYLTQVAQTAVCNRHHAIDQQLCRWLLMFLDRQTSNNLTLTQEQIGNLMGVRRESITQAAGMLQIEGSIHYHRGHVTMVDRTRLEAHSCECYAVAKREIDRLLAISQRSTRMAAAPVAIDRFRIERTNRRAMLASQTSA